MDQRPRFLKQDGSRPATKVMVGQPIQKKIPFRVPGPKPAKPNRVYMPVISKAQDEAFSEIPQSLGPGFQPTDLSDDECTLRSNILSTRRSDI